MARSAYNLPNILTYARILAVPLIVVCFFLEGRLQSSDFARWLSLAIFVVASLTDFLDGYLARKCGGARHRVSRSITYGSRVPCISSDNRWYR